MHLSASVKKRSNWCLNSVFKLSHIDLDLTPPQQYVNMMKTVVSGSLNNVPWANVMPKIAHKAFIEKIINQVKESHQKLSYDYYMGTYVPGNVVIGSLQRTKIDNNRFNALVDDNVANLHAVNSFVPDFLGYANLPEYDRLGTLTGRLKIESGPQILTLKKEYRDLLIPEKSGKIISVDFAALEVRVLLYEAGRRCDDRDLYQMIANELGYDRKSVKGAVISELYGSSKYMLGKTLGISGKELTTFVDKVKMYFNTPELLKRIKQQFVSNGKIVNRYGRQIIVDEPLDHIFINYYAQSTGVDVSLLGFSDVVKTLAKAAPGVRPLFLLHDALILDVPDEHVDYVLNNVTSVNVHGYVQKFPLKTEILSCTQ